MITSKKFLIDLNSMPCYFDVPTIKGASYEHGQNHLFSSNVILTFVRIPQMRPEISGRLQSTKFFMHGSIFMYGFRAIDLSRKFARYRIMLALHATELYHMGFRGLISKSTLADANNQRDWHIYADFAQVLIHR